MRTSATYMFDKADNCAAVSIDLDGLSASIEFRGDDRKVRQHYVRVTGLNQATCKDLARGLAKAARELARKARRGAR